MHVGFKTGPHTFAEGQRIVQETGATLCELWFRIDQASTYEDDISWLTNHGVRIGLHHWGLAQGRYKTNIMTHHDDIRDATLAQIKETIDIGQQIGCAYVNAHAGALHAEELNFDDNRQRLADRPPTTPDKALKLFVAAVQELHTYAAERDVVLTFETLPGREASILGFSRADTYDAGNASLEMMKEMSRHGFVANDITHTGSMIAVEHTEENEMWDELFTFTGEVAARTKLLHLNTVMPPHNGTDSHDGITDRDFANGVWPNKEQVTQLLTLFRERDDVFVIPEPREQMGDNYLALQKLVTAAQA